MENSSSYRVTGLSSAEHYTVSLYSTLQTRRFGITCFSELPATADFATKPQTPTGVTVSSINSKKHLKVSWTAVPRATQYRIQWKSGNQNYNTGDRQATINSGGTTTHTITGLAWDTQYTVRIVARHAPAGAPFIGGDSAWSKDVSRRTVKEPTLAVSDISASGATLTIGNHVAAWWYKGSQSGATCTSVAANTATATLSNLDAGTSYTYKAYRNNTCATLLATAATFLTKPAKTTGVSVTVLDTKLKVDWTAVTSATGYKVQWKSGNQEYNTGSRQATVTGGTAHRITGLTNSTAYTIRVAAVNGTGDGAWSDEASGTPAAVTLAASNISASGATLTITNHIDAWWYKGSQSGATCTSVAANTASATLSNLDAGTSFTYKAYSNNTCATELATAAAFLTKPAKTTGVSVTVLDTKLKVSWTAVTSATSYKVQWKSGNQEYNTDNRQATVSGGTVHRITGLTNSTAYTIRVAAVNGTGDGAWSDEASGTPAAVTLAASNISASGATLTIANHIDAWWYKGNQNGATCTSVAANIATATLSNLDAGTSYTYKAYSNNTCATELATAAAFLTKPGKTTGVTVMVLDTKLKVDWTAVTSATGYKVQWKSGNQEYNTGSRQATVTGAMTKTITGLTNSTAYTIRVAAVNGTGDGAWSNEASGTPAAVTLVASEVSATGATLTIGNHIDAWWYKGSQSGATCTSVAANTASATLSNLDAGTSYTYKAYSNNTCAVELATASAFLTKPAKTTGVAVTVLATKLKVSWTAVTSATSYKVQWKSGNQEYNTDNRQATVSGGTTKTITGLINSTTYTIRVAAINGTGDGAWSDEASGTPAAVTLVASEVSASGATLTISNHIEAWWYKGNQSGASCTSVAAGTASATLSSLDAGTSFTYKAYSNNTCTTELATAAAFLTKPGKTTGVSATALATKLKVSWTAVTSATSYKVQWKSGAEEYDADNRQATVSGGTAHRITGLTNSTAYTIRVAAVNGTGDGAWSDEASGTPVAVTLAASNISASGATLTIANHIDAWWYKGNQNGATCVSVAADTAAAMLSSLNAGTSYTYKAYSNNTCATELATAAAFLTKPAKTTGVSVTVLDKKLKVSWTAASGTVSGYKVQWKSGNQAYDATRQASVTGGSSTTHTITGLTNSTEYTIRIAATNTTGDGAWSNEASGTPAAVTLAASGVSASGATLTIANHIDAWWYKGNQSGATCTSVAANIATATLSNLDAGTSYTYKAYSNNTCSTLLATTAAFLTKPGKTRGVTVTVLDTKLKVDWTAVTSATGYKVQWKSGAEEYDADNRQATVSGGTAHRITSLNNSTTYTIRVAAVNGTGDGAWSNEASGTPAAVTLVASEVSASGATLTISNHIEAWWYKGNQSGATCTSVAAGTASATLSSLDAGTSFTYKAYSNNTCATELATAAAFLTKPAKTTGVSTTILSTKLEVAWTAVTSATGYKVQWKSGNQEYNTGSRQATVTGAMTHTITGLSNSTAYTIRVAAVNGTGDGAWSNEVTATPLAVSLTISEVESTTAKVTIANYKTDILAGGKSWYFKNDQNQDSCAAVVFADSQLANRLPSATAIVFTAYSAVNCPSDKLIATADSITTKPGKVAGVTLTELSTKLKVSWTAQTGTVTGYKVQWKSGNQDYNTGNRQKTVIGASTISTSITGLTNDTAYTVKVTAYNTTGDGPASNEATATPAAVTLAASNISASGATLTIDNHIAAWWYKGNQSGATCTSVAANTATATLSSLNAGTSYTYKAYSDNTCATELATAAAFLTKPAKTAGISTTILSTELEVAWTAVTSATSYKVQWKSGTDDYNNGNRQKTVTSGTTTTITGLTNSTKYTIRVAATNATGDGAWSNEVTATPLAVSLTVSEVESTTAKVTIANYKTDILAGGKSWYFKNDQNQGLLRSGGLQQ